MANTGPLSIDSLTLLATALPQPGLSRALTAQLPPLQWDDDELQTQLPLRPGARFAFRAQAIARSGCAGYTLAFKFASQGNADHCRQLLVPLPLELGHGLSVTALEVLEWDGAALPDLDIPALGCAAALVGFEVVNSSPVALFSLAARVRNDFGAFQGKAVLLGPSASRRLTLPVQCFALPPFVPSEERPKDRMKPADRYVEELSKRIELSWASLVSPLTPSCSNHLYLLCLIVLLDLLD